MATTQCSAMRRDGQRCAAQALPGDQHCFFHSTKAEHVRQRKRGRRKGGTKSHIPLIALPSETPDLDLKQPGDVVQLLALTISQLRRGQIEPRIANGVGYLASIVLSAIETGWSP